MKGSKISIISIVLVSLAVVGAYLISSINRGPENEQGTYPIPTQTPTSLSTSDRADGWKEYQSNEYGFVNAMPGNYSISMENYVKSSLDPRDAEYEIKDNNGTKVIGVQILKYEESKNFYDVINEKRNMQGFYIEPTEVNVNNAKGIYSIRSLGVKSDEVVYAFPLTQELYININYAAVKQDVESNDRASLPQEEIIRTFSFL